MIYSIAGGNRPDWDEHKYARTVVFGHHPIGPVGSAPIVNLRTWPKHGRTLVWVLSRDWTKPNFRGCQIVWFQVGMPIALIQRERRFGEAREAVIGNIQGIAQSKLFHVVDTDNCVSFRFCRAQRRKEEAGEDGNDGDHDKQFDER